MPARSAHIPDLNAADPTDAALRRVLALRHLADRALVHGDAQERDVASRLIEAIEGAAEGPLDAALGLTGPGWMGALRRYRQARRDQALRRIWRENFHDLTATAAAKVIRQQWGRYKASAWPRHRDDGMEPTDDPERTLHRLLAAGHQVLSARRIREILTSEVVELQTVETAIAIDDFV